jgi:hypothetical protein
VRRKPRIYRSDYHGSRPWVFHAGIEAWSFSTWADAMHFANWYTQPEPTA